MRPLRRLLRLLPWLTLGLVAGGVLLLLLVRAGRNVEAVGQVSVELYQVVRPEIGGIVAEVLVEPGASVDEGAPLLRLESVAEREERLSTVRELEELRLRHRRLRRELNGLEREVHPLELERKRMDQGAEALQAEAAATNLAEAQVELEATLSRLERARRLAAAGLVSEQDLEATGLELEKARLRLAHSEIESRLAQDRQRFLDTELDLRRAEHELFRDGLRGELAELTQREKQLEARAQRLAIREAARTVKAAVTGIVVGESRRELLGKWVSAGDDLMTVIVPESIEFVAEVSELEVLRVQEGQPVLVEISGLPRQRFDPFVGRVKAVSPQAAPEAGRVVYPVIVHLDTPWAEVAEGRFLLRGGMRGTARISYRSDVPLYIALFELIAGRPS